MLIKTHSITAQRYCTEINVHLRTPLKPYNNKGAIKTNTNAKKMRANTQFDMFFSFQKGYKLYKLKTRNYSDLYALLQIEK